MKHFFLSVCFLLTWVLSQAQTNPEDQAKHIITLSKNKWDWMAQKDVGKLEPLFHDRAKFVHMSGTWKKNEEIDIIKTGRIWYKKVDVQDVAVEIVDNTAVIWSRIALEAIVRGSEAINQFTVTEIYVQEKGNWKLLGLTFSSVRDTHKIEH